MLQWCYQKTPIKVVDMETYTISELAKQFNISTRTIRYYEEIGLLEPKRSESGRRIFSKRERIRLQLIFRGKEYGFRLEEIREMIELFQKDRSGKQQLLRTIEYGEEKIMEVAERIQELEQIRTEMEHLLEMFRKKLMELESGGNERTQPACSHVQKVSES
jgi:DNA-binding transcriptional MerR regulator